jgi:hypothetical protein
VGGGGGELGIIEKQREHTQRRSRYDGVGTALSVVGASFTLPPSAALLARNY